MRESPNNSIGKLRKRKGESSSQLATALRTEMALWDNASSTLDTELHLREEKKEGGGGGGTQK